MSIHAYHPPGGAIHTSKSSRRLDNFQTTIDVAHYSSSRPVVVSRSTVTASGVRRSSASTASTPSSTSSPTQSRSGMLNVGTARSPDPLTIQRLASAALQSRVVEIEKLDSYLYQTYRLRNRQGFFYVLRCKPAHGVRLLRHEEERLEAEAGALQSLSGRSEMLNTRLIENNDNQSNGFAHLICGPFSGSILSDIEPSLSAESLAAIDQSLGQYLRRLSDLHGVAFGPLRQSSRHRAQTSWAQQFATMLESVLRDGEDALISLPYEGIRALIRKHQTSLGMITSPRLLLLEVGADRNIVVDPRTHAVTGVLDLSTAYWGDPFLCDVFYKPTASFARGFGRLPNGDADERVRQYMYVIYHTLLAVVRHGYRDAKNEAGDELDARRDLTTAMHHLNNAAAVR